MHNTVNTSSSMNTDTNMAHSNGYGNDGWANMSPYSQSPYNNSPMNEYSNWNGYMPHSLPSESLQRMPPPLAQPHPPSHQMIQPGPPPPMAHHQLPMLNTQWPSQLTNPTPSGSYSAPPLSMTPVSSVQPVEAPKLPTPQEKAPEKARKTLSIEQKRAMCQFSDENPGLKQADIGARFGVERSTVSKVLRHKEQFLQRDQDSEHGSVKRGKGKHPDFDRTLSNYVRRQQQSGFEVADHEIIEHAKLFAAASGNQDNFMSSLNSSWLQKFKQKHGIGAGRLMRRASSTNIPDSATMSTTKANIKKEKKSGVISPISASGQMSPLSESRSDEDPAADGLDFDFTYRQGASQSSTSLTTDFRDPQPPSFSSTTMSPTGIFTFSPELNTGAFTVDQEHHTKSSGADAAAEMQHLKKRSNTFPSLNIDSVRQQASSAEPMTPRHPPSSTAPSSALESPAHELHNSPFAIDTTLTSPPTLRRSNSNSSNTNRPALTPGGNSAVNSGSLDSSPVSPSQEDARRAANTLLNYIQSMSSNGQFDQGEYMTIVQLTKKLQVHQHQPGRPSIGGLSRIPEGDTELPHITEVAMETA